MIKDCYEFTFWKKMDAHLCDLNVMKKKLG